MAHIVLLGDSIFDNQRYVPPGMAVIDQLRSQLSSGDTATLLAIDGSVVDDVAAQAARIPPEATHVFVSCGGNDALACVDLLHRPVSTIAEALLALDDTIRSFAARYDRMITGLANTAYALHLCAIYDAVPGLSAAERMALPLFNEAILRTASRTRTPVVDLRIICDDPEDYSTISSIEPSAAGGLKIVAAIVESLGQHQ